MRTRSNGGWALAAAVASLVAAEAAPPPTELLPCTPKSARRVIDAPTAQAEAVLERCARDGSAASAELFRVVLSTEAALPALCAVALPGLVRSQGTRAAIDVERHLTSHVASCRVGAARACALFSRNPSAQKLLVVLLKDTSPTVVAAAAESAGALRLGALGPTLLDLLHAPDAEVRAGAVAGLALLGDAAAAAAVGQTLLHDEDADVRAAAAGALGTLGTPNAISALTQAASHDTNARVMFVAKESLNRLGLRDRPRNPTE